MVAKISFLRRKMFPIILSIIILFIFNASAFGQEKITITWWYESVLPQNLEAMQKDLVEPYEKAHPNIHIEITPKEQLLETLRTAVSAGGGPDIIMTMGPAEANKYAEAGLLVPLDPYVTRGGLNKLLPSFALDLGRFKGRIYSLPKTFESMGIIYNKTLFDKYGWKPPTNRKEWVDLCNAIKAQGIQPVISGSSGWRPTHEHFVTCYLNHYAGPDNVYKALTGKMKWSDKVFVDAIKMFKDDFLNYWPKMDTYFAIDADSYVPQVAMEKAAMLVVGSWGFQWMRDPAYWPTKDQYAWAPFPSLREGVPYPLLSVGVGTTLSVNKASKHVKETADFLVWMLSYKEGIAKLTKDFPGEWLVPIDIPKDLIPKDADPVFIEHYFTQSELMKKGAYGYTTWTFLGPDTWRWCYENIEQVWSGKMTPEDYMKGWEETFRKEVKAGAAPPVPRRK